MHLSDFKDAHEYISVFCCLAFSVQPELGENFLAAESD